jgi:hypothetical protein
MSNFRKKLVYCFGICISYWGYLLFSTQPSIVCDAKLYHNLGILLLKNGWLSYFQQGPLQEPIYPFLISLAMRTGLLLSINYLIILKFFQILSLTLTLLLTLVILKKLKINPPITVLTLLYLGLSPALVNSALSLYSEIITYPLLLALVLAGYYSWQSLRFAKYQNILAWGVALGASGLLLMLVKGIYEAIIPLFLLPFCFVLLRSWRQRAHQLVKRCIVLLLAFSVSFYGPLLAYKGLNKRHNGNFALTNRASWALYGNIARRSQRMDAQRIITSFAFIPGERFCQRVVGEQRCEFWSYLQSDEYGLQLRDALNADKMEPSKADRILVLNAAYLYLTNPAQNVYFQLIEILKMFFWESTRVGYVTYPGWLTKVFESTSLNNVLKILTALLSFGAFVFLAGFVWSNKKRLSITGAVRDDELVLLFFILTMLLAYFIMFSFFYFLIRYAFPIVSLFLIMIAFVTQQLLKRFSRER